MKHRKSTVRPVHTVGVRVIGRREQVHSLLAVLRELGLSVSVPDTRATRFGDDVRAYVQVKPTSIAPDQWIPGPDRHDDAPGFGTETHVVVTCSRCSEPYSDTAADRVCFASLEDATEHMNRYSMAAGWYYNGPTVVCDGCRTEALCHEVGHHLFQPLEGYCARCGITEPEPLICHGQPMCTGWIGDVRVVHCGECGHYEPDERAIPAQHIETRLSDH